MYSPTGVYGMASTERHGTCTTTADSVKAKLIQAARDGWIDRLIDTSRRNNLLFFRPVLGGSIEIPEGNFYLLKLLAGQTVPAASLHPSTMDRPNRILNIARRAQENQEEKGLQTPYLTLGFAVWKAEDGGRDYRAPVFLLPLEFKRKGSEYNSVEVSIAGDTQVNPVLLHVLRQRFGVEIAAEALIPEQPDDVRSSAEGTTTEPNDGLLNGCREKLALLASLSRDVPEFQTECAAVIGNFAFAKMAMVQDLKEAASLMSENQLIAAIAGDAQAIAGMTSEQADIDPHSLDEQSPDDEFCVVDADSSQQCAISGIALGQSAVVHGPAGTGKSQTITNLIATLVGRGKTVLFVAEKRAALEVVQQRLQRSQLGHLAIDLHGAEISSKKVMERVAETLNTVRHSKLPDCDSLHRQFSDRRARLNEHDKRMHTVSNRTNMTLFDMQAKLLCSPRESASEVRWRGVELERLTPAARNSIKNLLREISALSSLVTLTDKSPWTGMSFKNGAAVQNAIDTARRLARESIPALQASLSAVSTALGFQEPQRFGVVTELTSHLRAVEGQLGTYTPETYSTDLSQVLAPLQRGVSPLKGLWLSLTSHEYKEARKRAIRPRKGVKASTSRIVNELRGMTAEAARWRELTHGKGAPTAYAGLRQIEEQTKETRQLIVALQTLRGVHWDGLTFEEMAVTVKPFANDQTTPYRLQKLTELEGRLAGSCGAIHA